MLRAAVTLPLVLPPVVGGIALFYALGRNGILGQYLGWQIPFTQSGIVLAGTFVSMPFLVVTVEGAFRSADRGSRRGCGDARRIALAGLHPCHRCPSIVPVARGRFGAVLGPRHR